MGSTILSLLLRLTQFTRTECAFAAGTDSLDVSSWSYGTTYSQMFESILNVMVKGAPVVAAAAFAYGAFLMSISGAKPDLAEKGKGIMIDAVLGFGIAVGALGVVKTTACFIWGC